MRFAASLFFSVLAAAPVAFGQLDSLIKKNGKIYFGTITDCVLLSDPQGPTIIRSDFGALAPQGGGNWGYVEPSQNIFNFACLDIVVNFAQTNGKLVLGRSLVWHSQLPSWVSSISNSATLTSVLQNHIAQIALRYRGKIYSWIVTNEIFNDDGSFRNSVFYRTLGTNFVTIAFKAARAVDPNAKLYINDYNMDSINNKVKAMVNFVSSQKSAGTPIDGIGSETHLSASGAGGVEAALQKLASTGCDVAITELDIAGASSSDYVTVIKACLNTPKCVGITVSGISDRETLSPNALFDSNYQKKPAYNAVIAALS